MDDDGDDKDDTKRRTRNLSEKKRRDQFNMLVSELSNLITNNSRKMDKSSILKSTITYLKNYNEITVRSRAHDVQEDWKPAFLSNEEFTYLLLEALEAFVIVFSASGTIYYASDSILSLLGHKPEDVINTNIFDLTYEEDRPSLYNTLQKKATTTEPSGYNTSKENETMKFQIHIRRGPLNRAFSYDLVQFYGHSRAQHDKIDDERDLMDFEPRVLFVCIGRLHKPLLLRDVSLVDTSQNEFTSRHSLEWKFLFLDHRAPPIIGYLPFEVLGTSGYDYYHFDDLEKVVTCHEALMEKGELTSCHYRFLTKGQQWIWLQSRFYITYHQWNSKPEFVVCTHRVVSYDDVVETKEESVEQERTSETEANSNNMNETPADDLMPMSPSYLAKPVNESYDNSDQSTSQEASKTPNPHFIEQLLAKPSTSGMLSTSAKSSPKSNQSPTNVSPSNLSPTKWSPYSAYHIPPKVSPKSSPENSPKISPKNSPKNSPRSMRSTNMSLNMSPSNLSPTKLSPYSAYHIPPKASPKGSPKNSPRSMRSTNMSVNMSPSNLSPRSMLPPSLSQSTSPADLTNISSDMSGHMSETDSEMPSVHPSCTAVKVSDGYGNTFHLVSQNTFMTSPKDETRVAFSALNLLDHSSESKPWVPQNSISKKPRLSMLPLSTPPPPLLDQNNVFNTLKFSQKIFRSPSSILPKQLFSSSNYVMETTGEKNWQSHPASVKFVSASSTASTTDTVATTGASWPQVHNHYHDADGGVCSEAALLSEEASITHRNSAPESHELPESSVAVQYSIGTHYIDPVLYGSGALVSPSMMSAMPAPDIQDQAQIQEQLQRKHEELQQMIVRQQEELRRVKEQLLLARLGMLQPIVNVPSSYTTPEEMPNQQRGTAELVFPNAVQPMGEYAQVPVATITLQPPQSHLTHTLQHATHPTHSPHLPPPPEQQQNMPQ